MYHPKVVGAISQLIRATELMVWHDQVRVDHSGAGKLHACLLVCPDWPGEHLPWPFGYKCRVSVGLLPHQLTMHVETGSIQARQLRRRHRVAPGVQRSFAATAPVLSSARGDSQSILNAAGPAVIPSRQDAPLWPSILPNKMVTAWCGPRLQFGRRPRFHR